MSTPHDQISKLLSLVLRHQPEAIGLTLDEQGWADVDDLLQRLADQGKPVTRECLAEVVATNAKQRFRLSDDGQRIRANQGHSLAVLLDLTPLTPPATLFHGTATRFLPAILAEGLTRRQRQHVHLSADSATATAVGQRHGKPVVLALDAAAMHRDGYLFYRSDNGVWLTDQVPPRYLRQLQPD